MPMDEQELDEALEPLRELLRTRRAVSFNRKLTFKTSDENQMEVKIMANVSLDDLKEKISQAAGKAVGVAKDVAEKAGDAARDVAGKVSDAVHDVAGKAQITGKKAKLNAEIASARGGLKDKYTELGRLYYEKYAGHTDPDFAETAAAIEAALEAIEAKQAEIESLSVQEEPEEAAAETAEAAEAVEETADHVVDEIEDTVEQAAAEAANAAEEAASEAKKEFDAAVDALNNRQE